MKTKTFAAIKYGMMILVIGLAASKVVVLTQAPNLGERGSGIIGTWNLDIDFVDCTTGVTLFPSRAVVTFASGGTFIEVPAGVSPSTRYPGLGVWQHVTGRTYNVASKIFQFNADGTPNGKALVNVESEHNLDDTITYIAVARFFDPSGNLTVTRCLNATGTRLTGEE